MSFVDLLFPLDELEALGNKWEEPATKKRKIDMSAWNGQHRALALPRRQNSESAVDQRRPRPSPSSHPYGKTSSTVPSNAGTVKRSNSESNPSTTSTVNTSNPATTLTNPKSGLPSFIEPSILKTYLHHLHPNDRPRYSVTHGNRPDNQPGKDTRLIVPQTESDDAVYSPGSLTTDTSSPSSSDNCPTPSAGICDQLRSGPFGRLFDGMRITEHERDLMENLLNPGLPIDLQDQTSNLKRKAKEPEMQLPLDDFYQIDEGLLQRIFPTVCDTTFDLSYENGGYAYAGKDDDVHSSGLSPAAEEEEEEKTSPAGIVMYDYSALSVDDFFDLEEASATTGLAAK